MAKDLPIDKVEIKTQVIDTLAYENCECPRKRIRDNDIFVNGTDCNLACGVAWLPNNQCWDEFWAHSRTRMREKNRWTAKKGYYCKIFNPQEYAQDMYEINFSKPIRQGIPMKKGYDVSVEELKRSYSNPIQTCPHHWYRWYGTFTKEGKMVAYVLVERCGQMAIYSMILGHGNYMKDEIMYFLHFYIQKDIRNPNEEAVKGILGTAYYAWASGSEGLRFWKQQAGFAPYHLVGPNSSGRFTDSIRAKRIETEGKQHRGPHP